MTKPFALSIHHALAPTGVLATLLGALPHAELFAQASTAYETQRFGQPSGQPADLASKMRVHLAQGTLGGGRGMVVVRGGIPGNLGGLVVGSTRWNVPVLGATSLVQPLITLWKPFTSGGEAGFPLWNPTGIVGLKFQVQALHFGKRNTETVFVMSKGMQVAVVDEPSTRLDGPLGTTLARISRVVEGWFSNKPASLWRYLRPIYPEHRNKTEPPPGFDWRVVSHIDHKPTETQLFVARNDAGDIAVAFQPSSTEKNLVDWTKTNSNAFQHEHKWHRGFWNAYASIDRLLRAQLASVLDTIPDKSTAKVYFTGASLGGALATLAAFELRGFLCYEGYHPNNILMYSFNSPRVMATSMYTSYGQRVPHHFAFLAKDDLVTHVPSYLPWLNRYGFTHVPRVVWNNPDWKLRLVAGSGYRNDHPNYTAGLTFKVGAHGDYERRLIGAVHRPRPTLALDVVNNDPNFLLLNGNMLLRWSYRFGDIDMASGYDYVILVRDGKELGVRSARASWQYATNETKAWETGWPKGSRYYIRYVQRDNPLDYKRTVRTVGPYVDDYNGLTMSLTKPGAFVTLNWKYDKIGKYDWVGLFKGKPQQRICGANTWGWAVNKRSHTTGWQAARDLYVGYVAQDDQNTPGRVIKYAGPFHFLPAPTVRLTWPNLWPYMLQVNWTNARHGTSDWVAIYDRDPSLAGARRLFWSYAKGSSWLPTLVPWKRGYYGAFFEQDCTSSSPRLVAKFGPL